MTAVIAFCFLAGGLLCIAGLQAPPLTSRTARRRRHGNPLAVVGAALGAAALTLTVTAVPVAALLGAIAGGWIPSLLQSRRATRLAKQRAHRWPDLLDDLTSGVRAGLSLPQALQACGAKVDPHLREAFAACDQHYRRTGDFAASLEILRERGADPVLERIVHALAIAREVGGTDLTQVLRALGGFVREDLQVRGEIAARQSWTVNAARLAVAAPWIVLVMLSSRPATVAAYRTGEGALVLLAIAACSAIAYTVMQRVARVGTA